MKKSRILWPKLRKLQKESNKFLQADKNILSCLLLSQKPSQHAFFAEESR